jgi:hypothetical protein
VPRARVSCASSGDPPALRRRLRDADPAVRRETDVSVVRIFEEQEAYRQYVGNKLEWSAGLWSPDAPRAGDPLAGTRAARRRWRSSATRPSTNTSSTPPR